ncbi:hypothetical protein [Mycobacteroides abscessus]|uniref:hypothetical protein n=1 Tax=Mycobacteroides abscessus TaxID=36809 RepID=UPI00078CA72F|nr:hypothetical protein [Mycobacteroides abscessus]AMU58938.1 hypothetical protein A3O03_01240 [Mycobacteroides abscessus]
MAILTQADMFPTAKRNTLNYRGDIADHVMSVNQRWGPDIFGALYTPVAAVYDPEADQTKVTFRSIPRPQPQRAHQRDEIPLAHPDGNRRQRRHKGKKH